MRKLLLSSILFYATVHAWDSGPSKCMKEPCSGGTSKTVALLYTKLAFDTWTPIHRLADCPKYYKNDGFVCRRPASIIKAPSHPALAPPGFTNRLYHSGRPISAMKKPCTTVKQAHNCPAGYIDMGCFCLRGAAVGKLTCKTGYFCDKNRGRCYKTCPTGYLSTGEMCYKPGAIVGPEKMSCKAEELRYNTYCFPKKQNCPVGYELWGSRCTRCYTTCPSGWFRSDVATCAFRLRWRGNTHLYIVKNALAILKADPDGKKAYDHIMASGCSERWVAALQAESEYGAADGGVNAHSHYYNAAGVDYRGEKTECSTYTEAGVSVAPTAYDMIKKYLGMLDTDGCDALGRALHYIIDITMPLHTSGFGPMQTPRGLMMAVEAYVPSIQARYKTSAAWDKRWISGTPLTVATAIAKRSNTMFAKPLADELLKPGPVCMMAPPLCKQTYTGYCFAHDARVDAVLGASLQDAYHSVASWLYSLCLQQSFKW